MEPIELTEAEIAQILHASKIGASILDYPVAGKIHIGAGVEWDTEQPSPELVQSLARPLAGKLGA